MLCSVAVKRDGRARRAVLQQPGWQRWLLPMLFARSPLDLPCRPRDGSAADPLPVRGGAAGESPGTSGGGAAAAAGLEEPLMSSPGGAAATAGPEEPPAACTGSGAATPGLMEPPTVHRSFSSSRLQQSSFSSSRVSPALDCWRNSYTSRDFVKAVCRYCTPLHVLRSSFAI